MATTVQQATNSPSRWESFVSLNWYDGLISFFFRFVAKTSEPLLAIGIVVSAADFLQKGQLMTGNPMLATAWAWTQALAIEASTGPVLVFALQAFRARDIVKGWLYLTLAALLFVVGGAMLLLQLASTVTGAAETDVNPIVLYSLFVMRVIVSGGMVALSCTKHMRFSGLFAEQESPVTAPALSDETMQLILSKLAKLDTLEQAFTAAQQATIVTPIENVQQASATLPEHAESIQQASENVRTETTDTESTGEQPNSVIGEQANSDYADRIEALYKDNKQITVSEIVEAVGCSRSTANKWLQRVRPAQ
jgi:hypothetical protein